MKIVKNTKWLNLSKGGEKFFAPKTCSEETRQKLREANKNYHPSIQHKKILSERMKSDKNPMKTESAKNKLSVLYKNVPRSEEIRNKISISLKGRTLSDSHKEKIKLSWEKRKIHPGTLS